MAYKCKIVELFTLHGIICMSIEFSKLLVYLQKKVVTDDKD